MREPTPEMRKGHINALNLMDLLDSNNKDELEDFFDYYRNSSAAHQTRLAKFLIRTSKEMSDPKIITKQNDVAINIFRHIKIVCGQLPGAE